MITHTDTDTQLCPARTNGVHGDNEAPKMHFWCNVQGTVSAAEHSICPGTYMPRRISMHMLRTIRPLAFLCSHAHLLLLLVTDLIDAGVYLCDGCSCIRRMDICICTCEGTACGRAYAQSVHEPLLRHVCRYEYRPDYRHVRTHLRGNLFRHACRH